MENTKKEHPEPACIDSSDQNLDEGFYCKLCDMAWYNCLCCHDDMDEE